MAHSINEVGFGWQDRLLEVEYHWTCSFGAGMRLQQNTFVRNVCFRIINM